MIVRAVQRGVPEAKIAQALDLDVQSIVRKRNLLESICEEATELLKDKMVATAVFGMLRRMKPLRQIETATLMNDNVAVDAVCVEPVSIARFPAYQGKYREFLISARYFKTE
jgi:hypothetical protein